MNRKETTEFLRKILIRDKFLGLGKYWASEVSLDYGSKDVKRVDFMQFQPQQTITLDGIEKGIFSCYEIKSCKADFNSGFGKNFIAEKNYFVMTMSTYKELIHEIPDYVGVLCPVPIGREKYDEFEFPTKIDGDISNWRLTTIRSPRQQGRKRSMTELLFCMLRSGKEYYYG